MRRRLALAATAASIALPSLLAPVRLRAQGSGRLTPTPAQTEGPFYPVELPADRDADLLAQGARRYGRGQPTWLGGTLVDVDGRALRGGVVEIWQCDVDGHYHHPGDGGRADPDFQGFGRMTVGADGRFRFRTIRPAPYSGRTPHVHVKVLLGGRERLTTQLYVRGEPRNERDGIWRRLSAAEREAVSWSFAPGADGLQAEGRLVIEA